MARLSKEIEIEGVKYTLLAPTVGNTTEADLEYSKSYTKALLGGLLPKVAMEKKIHELGLWTDEDETSLIDCSAKLQECVLRLTVETDKTKRSELLQEFNKYKAQYIEISSRKQSLLLHTAESRGEEAKISSLLWKSTLKDGQKVWASLQEFLNEKDARYVGALAQEFISFISGIDEKMANINKMMEEKEEVVVPESGENTPVAPEEAKKEEVVVAVV